MTDESESQSNHDEDEDAQEDTDWLELIFGRSVAHDVDRVMDAIEQFVDLSEIVDLGLVKLRLCVIVIGDYLGRQIRQERLVQAQVEQALIFARDPEKQDPKALGSTERDRERAYELALASNPDYQDAVTIRKELQRGQMVAKALIEGYYAKVRIDAIMAAEGARL